MIRNQEVDIYGNEYLTTYGRNEHFRIYHKYSLFALRFTPDTTCDLAVTRKRSVDPCCEEFVAIRRRGHEEVGLQHVGIS